MNRSRTATLPLLVLLMGTAACSKDSPAAPSQTVPPTLTAPVLESPTDDEQLNSLRPTLKVKNGTSSQASGARTYEFELSTDSAFSSVAVTRSNIPEDATGSTGVAIDQDLQSTARYHWRARMTQGGTSSAWSATGRFKTKPVGYNSPGALYDPLISSETVGRLGGSGNITWMPGQGIRMNDQFAYVVYDLPQVIRSGEISVEVTGLGLGGSPGKGRIFSILDRLGVLPSQAKHQLNVQYRGVGGAPDNTITWKVVLGDNTTAVEPNTTERFQSVVVLDPSKVYLWQAFWSPTSARVVVKEGGTTGPVLYDRKKDAYSNTHDWNPDAMHVFLGTNNATYTGFDGTREGMTLRNLWVGSMPRPAGLGSALRPAN